MSNFDKHVLAFPPTHIRFGPIQRLQSIRKIINFWYTFGWKWWVISFCDYLGLSNSCFYDVDDVIGRADRFGFQNFCSPVQDYESVWPDIWPKNKCRSLWLTFHGPVILPYISKTVCCMNIILQDYESVWHDIWPQNKCKSLWPIFHGPVILPYLLKTVQLLNIILWDYESVWPDVWPLNIYRSLWPIFHGPVILPYILKTDVRTLYFVIMSQCNAAFALKQCRSQWSIFFMVQWFCLIS